VVELGEIGWEGNDGLSTLVIEGTDHALENKLIRFKIKLNATVGAVMVRVNQGIEHIPKVENISSEVGFLSFLDFRGLKVINTPEVQSLSVRS